MLQHLSTHKNMSGTSMKIFSLFLIAVIFILSCSYNDTISDPPLADNSDILQPLAVGNYWEYDILTDSEYFGTIKKTITSSKTITYNGTEIILFTLLSISSPHPESLLEYKFVADNFIYDATLTPEGTISEAWSVLPYRYNGEISFSADYVSYEVSRDFLNYRDKKTEVIKFVNDASSQATYYKLGVGLLQEVGLPVFDSENNQVIESKLLLKDYHIE